MVVGAARVDAPSALRDRDDQLGLVMVIGGLCRVVDGAALRHQSEFALQEEERLLAAVAAHLLLMLGVVASHAENAPHGEAVGGVSDRQRRSGPKRNYMSHEVP